MDELNRKLAGWAGFKVRWFKVGGKIYAEYPDGSLDTVDFTSSLDACFKWLRGELHKRGYNILFVAEANGYCKWALVPINPELPMFTQYSLNSNEEALTLCKAIEQLIDSE